jgi:hypothetical protein
VTPFSRCFLSIYCALLFDASRLALFSRKRTTFLLSAIQQQPTVNMASMDQKNEVAQEKVRYGLTQLAAPRTALLSPSVKPHRLTLSVFCCSCCLLLPPPVPILASCSPLLRHPTPASRQQYGKDFEDLSGECCTLAPAPACPQLYALAARCMTLQRCSLCDGPSMPLSCYVR